MATRVKKFRLLSISSIEESPPSLFSFRSNPKARQLGKQQRLSSGPPTALEQPAVRRSSSVCVLNENFRSEKSLSQNGCPYLRDSGAEAFSNPPPPAIQPPAAPVPPPPLPPSPPPLLPCNTEEKVLVCYTCVRPRQYRKNGESGEGERSKGCCKKRRHLAAAPVNA
uniref:Uncharacterized protein n=1 Tax=Vespula pensylvanica TaxID=30213 RepID=A0A834PHA7_VESPE|nr:hypothetical protein H0235_002004 [Vespula pensylvanica]